MSSLAAHRVANPALNTERYTRLQPRSPSTAQTRLKPRVPLALFLTSLNLCAQRTASIEGRVTNSVTGEAVGGVKVGFLDRHSHVYRTESDSTGSYRLTGLDDGDYRGEFTKAGFIDSRENPFSRVAGFVPVRVDARLRPWAVLHGRVVDEDAKPVAGVHVEIDPNPYHSVDGPGGEVADENGEFAFKDMAPGSYTVVAKPAAKVQMRDGVRLGTVAMYYPSTTEPAQAVQIPVRTGQNVSGIEIRLKNVPVRRVTGVVLTEAGMPAAHATVKLMGTAGVGRRTLILGMIMPGAAVGADGTMRGNSRPEIYTMVGPSPEPEVARVESHDDGTFEFAAVEPGDWRLSAGAGVDEEMPLGGVVSVLVSDKDIEDIRIRLSAPFAVEVTTNWGSEQAPAAAQRRPIPLGLTPVEDQPRAIVNDQGRNTVKMNGVFPGRYRVMPNALQAGYRVTAVMWGGRDVNGQVVELTPGAAPFQVILSSEFGKVRGTVEKGEGATVYLVSRESGDVLNYRQVECRAGGVFEIGEIPPGDYYAVAFDQTGILSATDLPAAIVSIASSVRVEAGSTAPVDLKVNKWPW